MSPLVLVVERLVIDSESKLDVRDRGDHTQERRDMIGSSQECMRII